MSKFRSFDEIFGGQAAPGTEPATSVKSAGAEINELPVELLAPYSKHTFKPYTDEKLKDLTDSVREYGILSPVLVRPQNGAYEIISGHNRVEASKLADKATVPAVVRELDDDIADILMVDLNLQQRETILLSERAKSYRIKYAALTRQGKRGDLDSDENAGKRAAQIMGDEENVSFLTIYRYVRLGHLTDELLDLADLKRFNIITGVELSHISEPSQIVIADYLQTHDKVKVDQGQAKQLREKAGDNALTAKTVMEVLNIQDREKKGKPLKTIKLPFRKIRSCFSDDEISKIDESRLIDLIVEAVRIYKERETEVQVE